MRWTILVIGLSGGIASQAVFLLNWLQWVFHPVEGGVSFTFYETSSWIIYSEAVMLSFTLACSLIALGWLYLPVRAKK